MALEVNKFTLAGNDIEVVDQYARDQIQEIITTEVTKQYVDNADAALQIQINNLPSKTYVDNADSDLQTQINNLPSKNYVDEGDAALQTQINGLPSKTYVDNADSALQTQINGLPSKTYVDNADSALQTQINGLPSKTYVDNADSDLQTQINTKQATITGAASTVTTSNLTASHALGTNGSGKIAVSSVTTTELDYLQGVTSGIQGQINAKQAKITGAASTVTTSNLTASRALGTNGSGKIAVSSVTTTELDCLQGVTSKIQTQLNNKVETSEFERQYSEVNADEVRFYANRISTLKLLYFRDNPKINLVQGWNNLNINGSPLHLSEAFRPITEQFLTVTAPGGQRLTVNIKTDGSVSIYANTAMSTGYTMRFNVIYI